MILKSDYNPSYSVRSRVPVGIKEEAELESLVREGIISQENVDKSNRESELSLHPVYFLKIALDCAREGEEGLMKDYLALYYGNRDVPQSPRVNRALFRVLYDKKKELLEEGNYVI